MQLRHTLPLMLLLCACSAPPKPAMPDGSQRVAVNTQDHIDAYLERAKQSRLTAQTEASCTQRIATLENQLGEARRLLIAWAKSDNLTPDTPAAAASFQLTPTSANGVSMAVRPGGMTFHFTLPADNTDFRPSGELQARLLPTAMASNRITIRTGTDAALAAPALRRLTERLSTQARDYLIVHGISADRIGIDSTIGRSSAKRLPGRRPIASAFVDIDIDAETLDFARQQPLGGAK
ncbi:hypothetical protein [Duganella sp. HH105]|uniref:hypothetical protein n=1 Tax=Duganella sp. HH105 TaxID=1781067 RepID=UPI000893AC9A|nr:hypothetical protein [Duganella sp. HH105]OEZ54862.1 hypothetical protein DUGA6_56330 [Duganella sp. HH105]